MTAAEPRIEVTDNAAGSRYEIRVDGMLAGFSEYHDFRQQRTFIHTEIEPEYEGRGLGGRLAAAALDDVRTKGRQVVASCPFIAAYIRDHEQYADLLVSR